MNIVNRITSICSCIIPVLALSISLMAHAQEQRTPDESSALLEQAPAPSAHPKTIADIKVVGNKYVTNENILRKSPYKIGELFDPHKRGALIRNLYYDRDKSGKFSNVALKIEDIDASNIILYIIVQEKPQLNKFIFKGNKHLSEKELNEKLHLDEIGSVDKEELRSLVQKIKKLYIEKNYHDARIEYDLELQENGTANAIFTITENKKSVVKRIEFKGNNNVSDKELRNAIFTREDWLLSFIDRGGSYDPERTETADRGLIEQYYQNHGYLTARVTDVDVFLDPKSQHITMTFEVKEGEKYCIGTVKSPGNDILNEEFLLANIPTKPGCVYSREDIVESIKVLEMIWGDLGYIYAHIDPIIQPNEETQTVDVTFEVELGNKVFLNKINIIGNHKTRDKIIRRRLLLNEGRLLTTRRMENSKDRVEALGYFDPKGGVNWKISRVNDNLADLDLIVKEVKTGSLQAKIGFGGSPRDITSVVSGITVNVGVSDTNLAGTGIAVKLDGEISKNEKSIVFNITQPWLFDRPIISAFDFYHKRPSYEDFQNTKAVNERLTGVVFTLGAAKNIKGMDTQFLSRVGIDSVRYDTRPIAQITKGTAEQTLFYQSVLNQQFQAGDFVWLALQVLQDYVNHPMHPSRGYKWLLNNKTGFPSLSSNIGFNKIEFDANWFTPLIGERDLVLRLHANAGLITTFKGRTTPYRELYHIGGPASVRGYIYGNISPTFLGDSIGGKKAFFVNAELIFPIMADFSMKGVVFYDGGAGWDTACPCPPDRYKQLELGLRNNNFSYRHAVGFGVRLLKPAPIRIDWGFKIDRRKRLGEAPYEVHFGMNYDF